MKTKVTIDKITITIGEKKLELTLEEAKALKDVLDDSNVHGLLERASGHGFRLDAGGICA